MSGVSSFSASAPAASKRVMAPRSLGSNKVPSGSSTRNAQVSLQDAFSGKNKKRPKEHAAEDEGAAVPAASEDVTRSEDEKVQRKRKWDENEEMRRHAAVEESNEAARVNEQPSAPTEALPGSSAETTAGGPKASDLSEEERQGMEQTWANGAAVPYAFVATLFARVEAEMSRLKIDDILTAAFRVVIRSTPEDLTRMVYMCTNKLAPAHEGLELGVGEGIVMKALATSSGRSAKDLKMLADKVGDLGDVAMKARTAQKTLFKAKPLTLREVFSEFQKIARATGKLSNQERFQRISKLFACAAKEEAKFICRALLGKLRIHMAEKSVIVALAHAFVLESYVSSDAGAAKSAKKSNNAKKSSGSRGEAEEELVAALKEGAGILSSVYSQLPSWDLVIPALLELRAVDSRLLERCKLTPGLPIGPMLAKPTKGIHEVIEKFDNVRFTSEFKYDGERAQVHRLSKKDQKKGDGDVRIYSRNAENHTGKYPDLQGIDKALKPEYAGVDFILDSEVVAYDAENHKLLPFQALQKRARKDVLLEDVKVPVCLYAFDLLYYDGKSMLQETLLARREAMHRIFNEIPGTFMFASAMDGSDVEQIEQHLQESIRAGCEGLMVKRLVGEQSTYEPSNRSTNWLKVKKDYLDGMGDTLDLVPIAGYRGRGKRTGWFGAYLLACYDQDSEEYQTCCKIGTGFSDEMLEKLSVYFGEPGRVASGPKPYYKGVRALPPKDMPDVWFEPCAVWEVLCADLSLSPVYAAAEGMVEEGKGIALRFPRFIRERDDKGPEQASDAEQIKELYVRQALIHENNE
ncbi:DNA ligase 1 [Porphyridium purpureum]|uniref:DNA ligase n=1 Tax=Porphyridium purpureum TaxID=35688 RepID=A0A5J4YJX6_PORPP|nr:DNA ligase 1 [Porphyridium purpureum]|eukprot:POR9539..scf244_11